MGRKRKSIIALITIAILSAAAYTGYHKIGYDTIHFRQGVVAAKYRTIISYGTLEYILTLRNNIDSNVMDQDYRYSEFIVDKTFYDYVGIGQVILNDFPKEFEPYTESSKPYTKVIEWR
jgi:hypothetical protein